MESGECSAEADIDIVYTKLKETYYLGFPQAEVIQSIPNDRPGAHSRKKDTVRRCNAEECGDEVCVETWNDRNGHVSQEGVQGSSQS